MKKWTKKILAAVLCLMMLQIPAAEPLIAVQTVQAASTAKAAKVKNGLKKEGGQYYYYVKGKKVKNTWKTVTVANKTTGKKMTYRYYFSNTGKAYKGGTFFGENYLLVKKIGGKYYGFNRYAQMVKGVQKSSVYFGNYKQSSDGNGDYLTEPIKWRVLQNADGKLFLLADKILDVYYYHHNGSTSRGARKASTQPIPVRVAQDRHHVRPGFLPAHP